MGSLFRIAWRHDRTVRLLAASLLAAFVATSAGEARDRTLKLQFTHTGERGEFTYKRNGKYDQAVLDKLNHILRDWRRNEEIRMDPRLFDIIWEVYREVGGKDYIHVVSGYRSVKTNDMLRRRSRGVAKQSRHTRGQAMDFFIPGVSISEIRKAGLRLQQGGVGYYPTSGSPFVHLDTGTIRHWPRMTRQQLAAVFPNGQTLHIPSDGKPLKGYEIAKARYGGNNGTAVAYLDTNTRTVRANDKRTDNRKGTVANWLKRTLSGGADEAEDNILAQPQATEVAEAVEVAPLPRELAPSDRRMALAMLNREQLERSNALLVARTGPARPDDAVPLGDRFKPALPPMHTQDQIKLTRLLAQAALRADQDRDEATPATVFAMASASGSQQTIEVAGTADYRVASGPSAGENPDPGQQQIVRTAIDAANAIGSASKSERALTVTSQDTVALAYASFTPQVPLEPKTQSNPAALLRPRSRPLLTQPEVEVTDAALEEAENIIDWENPVPPMIEPVGIDFARFMGEKTTRTDVFVAFAMPQPWSYPALFDAPENVFDASRNQSGQNLRFDRFAKSDETIGAGGEGRNQRVAEAPDPTRFLQNF